MMYFTIQSVLSKGVLGSGMIMGGGQQRRRRRHGAAGSKDDLGKRRRPTAGRGGVCASRGEHGVLLRVLWYGGLHRPVVAPDCARCADGYLQLGRAADKHSKNRGDGVPAMPGGQGAVRRGLHTENDRGGTELQGEAVVEGDISILREGICKGVTGGAPPNPARRGKMGVGEGG